MNAFIIFAILAAVAFIIFAILAAVAFIVFAFVFIYQLRTYEKPLAEETPETYPYKYQTPFDDKLIELGVKEKYDCNLGAFNSKEGIKDEDMFWSDAKLSSFGYFMYTSYRWGATPEGFSFWQSISTK